MAVVVDNVTYPLTPSKNSSILYSGQAPAAQSGYRYVKITKENDYQEIEPLFRQPTKNKTVNEFFNRSWNSRNLTQLPVLYQPLDAIHRINSSLHRDGEIPTIHLVGNQTQFDIMHNSNSTEDYEIMSNMTYITLNEALSYQNIKVSLAGRSSRWMPKLSYNIKMNKKDSIYGYRSVKLRALDTDPSYIREQLAYDIIKSVGLLSSEFSYCRVFLNDKELGLFGIIETFKNPWLANSFANGDTKYKNGNLYQGAFTTPQASAVNRTSDLSFYDNITAYADGQYEIKEEASESKKDDWKPLMDFTEFIAKAPTSETNAVASWKKQLDTDSFLRAMALEVILGYSDGYLSMADNYYLYQNLDTGKFFYISSDMDLTFGSTMFKLDDMWRGNYSTFPGLLKRPLMKKMMKVPEFKQQYEDLVVNMTKNLINPVGMNNRINDIVGMIEEDVNWDQTLPRVGKNILSEIGSAMNNGSLNNEATAVIGDGLPSNMDMEIVLDFAKRMNETISLKGAVNGPTGFKSLAGVKEWVQKSSENTLKFYNVSNAQLDQ
jgi:spore coat protein CotH